MSNWSRCFRIGLGYRYAPESFYISLMQSDGSYKKLDVDTSGYMWGYWLSIGQEEKAVAESFPTSVRCPSALVTKLF